MIFFLRHFFRYFLVTIFLLIFLGRICMYEKCALFHLSYEGQKCAVCGPLCFRKQEATMSRLELVCCLLFCSMGCPWKRHSWTLMSWKPSPCTRSWRPPASSSEQCTWWADLQAGFERGWFACTFVVGSKRLLSITIFYTLLISDLQISSKFCNNENIF